jgi:hypothetical protein
MARHLWLVVLCKTPDCENLCPLKYYGLDMGQDEFSENCPPKFSLECKRCRREYRYKLEETRVLGLNVGPPRKWANLF